jgi:hypothetical protein
MVWQGRATAGARDLARPRGGGRAWSGKAAPGRARAIWQGRAGAGAAVGARGAPKLQSGAFLRAAPLGNPGGRC